MKDKHWWMLIPTDRILHHTDVIMTTMASQITSLAVVYSTAYSDADQWNIKAPRHWPLCGEFTGTGEFPAQRASYAENVSIWWRHHGVAPHWLKKAGARALMCQLKVNWCLQYWLMFIIHSLFCVSFMFSSAKDSTVVIGVICVQYNWQES